MVRLVLSEERQSRSGAISVAQQSDWRRYQGRGGQGKRGRENLLVDLSLRDPCRSTDQLVESILSVFGREWSGGAG